MISKKRKILNIITEIRNSHPEMKDMFMNGSCLNLHMILRAMFPEAEPYYNVDHVITKIDDSYYDIRGVVLIIGGYDKLSSFYKKKKSSRAFSQMYKYVYKFTNGN